jgi:hypothetical protein
MRKDSGTAYILWAFGLCGLCGLHRFYLGQPVPGILYLLTFGVCGIGQLVDLFLIPGEVRTANLLDSKTTTEQNVVVQVGDNYIKSKENDRLRSVDQKTTKPLSLAHKILEECSAPHPISLAQIIIATGEPLAEVKKTVEELATEGLISQEINENGSIVYKTCK